MRRHFCLWMALGWIALAASAQEPAKTSIAIYPIKAAGAEASLAQALTSLLSTQLTPSPKLRVIEEAMLKTVMERQGLNASDACDDTTCQVQIGKLIQAQKIITGDIAKLGSKYVLSLKLIDIQTGALEFTTQDKCACPEDELDALVAVAGAKVRNHFGEKLPVPELPAGQAFTPVAPGAPATPQPAGAAKTPSALPLAPGQKPTAPPEVVDAFFKAVEGGNLQETQMLINSYIGLVNARYYATKNEKGAEVKNKSLTKLNVYKFTPLHFAVWGDHKAVCELLLDNGADVNAIGGIDESPLCLAVHKGTKEVVELLVAKGADVNYNQCGWLFPSKARWSPLEVARKHDYQDIADFLIQHGAKQ